MKSCLTSVAAHLPELKVHVWDNSGPDYVGMEGVRVEFPTVEWHGGNVNVGFAAGVNALAELVPECDLLLLNPDAELLGPLDGTRRAIRRHDVAAAAPTVVDSANPESESNARPWDVAHRPLTLTRALVARVGYAERLRNTPFSDMYRSKPIDVAGYLTGACLGISRDAWEAVGPFDEEFFLYGEELHWQRRAVEAGFRLELVDEPGIEHGGHGTVANDTVASLRSRDHLRANIALNLDLAFGGKRGDIYLASTSILDRIQRSAKASRKARRQPPGARPSVVITTNRLVYGGAERQTVLLATELDRRGYAVTVCCVQRFGPLVREMPMSVRLVRQPWWFPALDLDEGPQVVITDATNTEAGFGTLWKRRRADRKWIVAGHTPPNIDAPTYSAPLAAAFRRADGFIALSERHWEELTEHQELNRVHFTAPNGVMSAESLSSSESMGPNPSPAQRGRVPQLVMLSRIVEHKNPHLLVEALEGLDHLPWELSIYGDGPDRERLQALTPKSLDGRVHWRGWSPGPEHAFAECDLVCVPSGAEAFPLVILEAMARRIPVVASAVCAVPEMLDAGAAGVLVDPITVDAWRSTLSQLLENPDELPELGMRGYLRTKSHYTIETMADAYEAAIDAVFSPQR
ncbi:glycosyltransferase [Antrihabitans cavernicola]|uniref:Glycosyltransferase n=1 Tax=Antrihabitans cavernicola TaxID=2495913 RepID=A0A5A7SJA7_9NOCA|nr:glycosyltransferase [Spelaeibacter cavernicola]